MDKLQVELFLYDTMVFGKIINTPNELRGEGLIYEHEGYKICSRNIPAISDTTLWLQGRNTARDYRLISYEYYTHQEAEKAFLIFKYMIEQINNEKEMEIC